MRAGFTMATWNTLATAYIRREYYPRTPAELLDPAWRVPAIVAHARGLDADILCLQEVETEVFHAMQQGLEGYHGIHELKGKNKRDGCATFFRTDSFTLLNNFRIEYRDHSGHISQFVLLGHAGKRLAVVNTHLKWDPPDALRETQWGFGQIFQAMEIFDAIRSNGQVICGDFNAPVASEVGGALFAAGFDYAHKGIPGLASCNSNGKAKLIDHLFWRGSLSTHGYAPPAIDGITPLPSASQPSDHLPLVARFEWLL